MSCGAWPQDSEPKMEAEAVVGAQPKTIIQTSKPVDNGAHPQAKSPTKAHTNNQAHSQANSQANSHDKKQDKSQKKSHDNKNEPKAGKEHALSPPSAAPLNPTTSTESKSKNTANGTWNETIKGNEASGLGFAPKEVNSPSTSTSTSTSPNPSPNLPSPLINALSPSSLAPTSAPATNNAGVTSDALNPLTPAASIQDQSSVVENKTRAEPTPNGLLSNDMPSKITSFIDSLFNVPWLGGKSPSPEKTNKPEQTTTLASVVNAVVVSPSVAIPPVTYSAPSKFAEPVLTPYSVTTGERNTTGDNALIDMASAFKRGDRKRLSSTLVYAQGHPLEPWAAYWELRSRLDEASYTEVRSFLKRYAGTYQEDRMRNDWLLMAGSRRDWDTILDEYPFFRMRDDKELQCYYLLAQFVQLGAKALPETAELVLQNWQALKDSDDGCMLAVDRLYDARKISDQDIWRKVRIATEFNSARLAKNALKILEPKYLPELEDIFKSPAHFLSQQSSNLPRPKDELVTLALIRLSASDPVDSIRQFQNKWSALLNPQQRAWVWAVAGREAALRNDIKALDYFERASSDKDISNDELLGWKVRVSLRMDIRPRWEMVESAINAMSANSQKEPTWVYWRARALLAKRPQTPQGMQEAQALLNSIASARGFYEQLALEELGKKIMISSPNEPLKPQELQAAKSNPTIRRALYAINLGLRSEGNREWNYGTSLVDNTGHAGGMTDRELLAAATLACEIEIWDRCVNAAERAKLIEPGLRFPMPFKELVLKRTKDINLDPAYVYGLIRQESRFVMDAKSTVGASGLMQIMPKTAIWTAKKIGLINFKLETLNSREVNISIGTGYLKLVLDSFDGSMPMAAAAYNAGPSRVRHWQEGSVVEGAIWAEFLPFNETRDYVKKVLSNTINYEAVLTSEPQSLKARLGMIGPIDASKAALENPDMP